MNKMNDTAIIGIALKLPEASTVEEFWKILTDGKCVIGDLSDLRKEDVERCLGPVNFMSKGYIERIDLFDNEFFKLSKADAESMDPEQRLFLETAVQCMYNAGYSLDKMRHSETGIYLNSVSSQYGKLSESGMASDLANNDSSLTPSRVSYFLDLRGPAVMFNTTCSSSLIAIHYACQALQQGECQQALVGGVAIGINTREYAESSPIYSSDYTCRTFDKNANGATEGEGIITVMLKPLDKAIEDNDYIYGVVKGSAANQDGARTQGVTAPSPEAQTEVIQKALKNANVEAETISYIEAHGTGTVIGDPIEALGLKGAFSKGLTGQTIAIGSVKTNIGHLGGGAGIAGFLKTVLCLNQKTLVPSLHFKELNPHIDFKETPFYVNTELKPWKNEKTPRRAGVSSFGLSGTNVHVVLEEYCPVDDTPQPMHEPELITLSDTKKHVLDARLLSLQSQLNGNLADIGYTLNTTFHTNKNYRSSVIASTHDELKEKLSDVTIRVVNKKIEHALYLISHDSRINKTLENYLIARSHLFRSLMNRCKAIIGDFEEGSNHHKFIYFYCLSKLLISLGVQAKPVIGFGIGDYVAKALSSEDQLESIIEEIKNGDIRSRFNKEKFTTFIPKLNLTDDTIVINLGESGSIYETISQSHFSPDFYTLTGEPEHFLSEVNRLYLQGADLDFSVLYSPNQHQKQPMYHPVFDSVRCWIEPKEEAVIDRSKSGIDAVREIWKNVLKCDEIEPEEDFFEIGGNSLNGLQVLNLVEEHFGFEGEIEDLFEFPTLQEFTDFVENKKQAVHQEPIAEPVTSGTTIKAVSLAENYPLSSAQERLWLLQQLDETSSAYNMHAAFKIEGDFNVEKAKETVLQLIDRHESLRTVFQLINGKTRQIILDTFEPASVFDFSVGLEENLFYEKVTNALFHLENGPLFKVFLNRVTADRFLIAFNMHHIVSDGWSLNILMRDFIEIYQGLLTGNATHSSLKIQYKDYCGWMNERAGSDKFKASEHFWLNEFKDEIPILQLQTDKRRPAVKTYHGEHLYYHLSEELLNTLKMIAKEHDATLFMVLLAAVHVFFSKYSGQNDIVIGTPVSGRTHKELSDQIGLYINTLALRNKLNPKGTFGSFLKDVKSKTLHAFKHQDYPFNQLVSQLPVNRDTSRSPLFDVMMVLQNMDDRELRSMKLSGLTIDPVELEYKTSKFDLMFSFSEKDDGLALELEYNTDLFLASTMHRMLEHLSHLLGVLNQNIPIEQYQILSETEQKTLVETFNSTAHEFDKNLCLHELFEAQVKNTPEAIALRFHRNRLTYAELNEKANQLAHYLIGTLDIQPDEPIAIMLDRSENMVISMLAALKTGGAYLPIDPSFPEDRIQYIIAHSEARVLITSTELSSTFTVNPEVRLLSLETLPLEMYPNENLNKSINSNQLAYIIYTSGSTGRPKGVMIPHMGAHNRILWMKTTYNFGANDKVLQKTPYVFDVSVWEFFMTLCYGAELVLCEKDAIFDTDALISLIGKYQITTMHFVPSMFNVFLHALTSENKRKLITLRQIFTSGEALPLELVHKHHEMIPHSKLHNLYGPTEASVDVSFHETSLTDDKSVIGKPIWNTKLYVLDSQLNIQPIGVVGELHIEGIGLARGYLNQAELTNEKFIPNPFSKAPESRLYKTGDLARVLEDGSIDYIGRTDFQVKVRGFRIELGEIDATLRKFPSIEDTIVLTREINNTNQIIAYVVARVDVNIAELRKFLGEFLPSYMVPEYFIQMKTFPLTVNGKLDRKALPSIEQSLKSTNKGHVAPRNKIESYLVNTIQYALQQTEISVRDNFFEIGGNSMALVSVYNLINQQYPEAIKIVDMFSVQTIEALAELIQKRLGLETKIEPPKSFKF